MELKSGNSEVWLFNELSGTFTATQNSAPVYFSRQVNQALSIYADNFGGATVHLQWSFYPDKNFTDITDIAGNPMAYTTIKQAASLILSGFYVRAQVTGTGSFTVSNLTVKIA